MVVQIFQRRLAAKEHAQQQQQRSCSEALEDLVDVDGAPPSLSFFELIKNGNLKRTEAAKLFYQILVTHSTTYVKASQAQAFGDIAIAAGSLMPPLVPKESAAV